MYVVETVEMLSLDAMEYAPTIWVVLTAREHLDAEGLSQASAAARRRRRGGAGLGLSGSFKSSSSAAVLCT